MAALHSSFKGLGRPVEGLSEEALSSLSSLVSRPNVRRVFDCLIDAGGGVCAVGGTVRNSLLGLPRSDVDLATTLLPEAVLNAAEATGLRAFPTGIDHGTVTIISDAEPFEVTTLRDDVEGDGRHAVVAFGLDWAVDAARRDFTMNALYADRDGAVYDPLGTGVEDLLARKVRFIGEARQRLREDYLRILRFFRFNAEYGVGALDCDGLEACVAERHGLEGLSAERISTELFKLLRAERAGDVFEVMFTHGLVMPLTSSVPCLGSFQKMISIEEWLDIERDGLRRLGCLFVLTDEDVQRVAASLRLSNSDKKRLAGLVVGSTGWSKELGDAKARELLYRLGHIRYSDQVLIAWARSGDRLDDTDWGKLFDLPQRWEVPVFSLSGKDVQAVGLSPGPDIGVVLRRVEQWWVEQDFVADDAALREALTREVALLREP